VLPEYFVDVNGDGFLSPMDPLRIINALNQASNRASAEGEAAATLLTADPVADRTTIPAVSLGSFEVGPPREAAESEADTTVAPAEVATHFDSSVYSSRSSVDAAFAAKHDEIETSEFEELLDLLAGDEV
jgi:hypothetical protein